MESGESGYGLRFPRVSSLWWIGVVSLATEGGWEGALIGGVLFLCGIVALRSSGGASAVRPLALPLVISAAVAFIVTALLNSSVYTVRRGAYLWYSREKGWLPAIVVENAAVMFCASAELFPAAENVKQIARSLLLPLLLTVVARAAAILTDRAQVSIASAAVMAPFLIGTVSADSKELPPSMKQSLVQILSAMPIVLYVFSLGPALLADHRKILDGCIVALLPYIGTPLGGGSFGLFRGNSLRVLLQQTLWAMGSYRLIFFLIEDGKVASVLTCLFVAFVAVSRSQKDKLYSHGLFLYAVFLIFRAWIELPKRKIAFLFSWFLILSSGAISCICAIVAAAPVSAFRPFLSKAIVLECLARSVLEVELRSRRALPEHHVAISVTVGVLGCFLFLRSFRNDPEPRAWLEVAIRCHLARSATCFSAPGKWTWLSFALSLAISLAWPPMRTPFDFSHPSQQERLSLSRQTIARTVVVFFSMAALYPLLSDGAFKQSMTLQRLMVLTSVVLAVFLHPLALGVGILMLVAATVLRNPGLVAAVVPSLYLYLRRHKKAGSPALYLLAAVQSLLITADLLLNHVTAFTLLGAISLYLLCFAVGISSLSLALPTYLELLDGGSHERLRMWLSLALAALPPTLILANFRLPLQPILPSAVRIKGSDSLNHFIGALLVFYALGLALVAISCRIGDILSGTKNREWTQGVRLFTSVASYLIGVAASQWTLEEGESAFTMLAPILLLAPLPQAFAVHRRSGRGDFGRLFAPLFSGVIPGHALCAILSIFTTLLHGVRTDFNFLIVLSSLWQSMLLFLTLSAAWYFVTEFLLCWARVRQPGMALVLALVCIPPVFFAASSATVKLGLFGAVSCGFAAFKESDMLERSRRVI